RDAAGSALVPSIVAFPADGPILVGDAARARSLIEPETTVYLVKRLMGKDLQELDRERATLPYSVVAAERKLVRVDIRGRQYTPQEISAMILAEVKRRAERRFGEEVTEAVI